jgi:hypothetical protein
LEALRVLNLAIDRGLTQHPFLLPNAPGLQSELTELFSKRAYGALCYLRVPAEE